jgi:hypothetical protein
MAETVVTAPIMATEPETGATVADARRLAASAALVAVLYWCGPDYEKHCLFLERPAFLSAIRGKPDDEVMPCRMTDGNILMIGVFNG